MTASLNALKSAKGKVAVLIALTSLVATLNPATTKAATAQTLGQDNSLVFNIKTMFVASAADTNSTDSQNQNSQISKENAEKKAQLLQAYLESKNSPLADYAGILMAQQDWKTILAISNAESTLGQHCYYNNCSGIYGTYGIGYSGLKRYETKADWIVDLQSLLSKRYEGWTLDQMNGIYVYPKSSTWIRATKQVYNDLTNLENQFPDNAAQNS